MSIRELIEGSHLEPQEWSDADILKLLAIDCHSEDLYHLLSASNALSRRVFNNIGYVFVQLGLNAEPCSGNCLFCSMGKDHFSIDSRWRKSSQDVVQDVLALNKQKVDDVFLMSTVDYPLNDYISIVESVKPHLGTDMRLVANVGDFDISDAQALKKAGVTGVYHVNRLREGIDTSIDPEQRERTIDALRSADLELYYCIEPIGAEHSYEEILYEIRHAQQLQPEVMAVMRRVTVENTPMAGHSSISAIELTKIAAVTNLVVRPKRAMNLHETEQMSLLAGVNQLYAEFGANPRDTINDTQSGRGLSVSQGWSMLREAGYFKSTI